MDVLKDRTLQRTKDGYLILARFVTHPNEAIVICAIEDNPVHPFVTWQMDLERGHTYQGDYCPTLGEAVTSFLSRGGKFE